MKGNIVTLIALEVGFFSEGIEAILLAFIV